MSDERLGGDTTVDEVPSAASGDAPAAAESPAAPDKKKRGKGLLILIAVVVLAVLAGAFAYLTYQRSNFVSTDNASVQGNMVTVPTKMAGTIRDVVVKQGDFVHAGDVLVTLDPSTSDAAQIDNANVRAPIDGMVLRTVGSVGQLVPVGQTVAYVTSMDALRVVANIDEKDINSVKLGQDVDISVDQFGGRSFQGKVTQVGSATLSAFSIVPASASGSFVKATQYVPIEIQFVDADPGLVVGANAAVTIHIT